MNHKAVEARIRKEAVDEAREAEEQELRIEQRLRKWKRSTISLGIALIASIAGVVPFLDGYPLHDYWDAVGKKILLLSMGLLPAFMWTTVTTYNFWRYLRDTRETHRKFAPPGSKYRAGKSG
jgi:hypothetical protein